MPRLLASMGAAYRPASKQAGGKDKQNKKQARHPGDLARGELDFQKIKRQGKKQGDKQGEPERDRSALEHLPDGPNGEECAKSILQGEVRLEKRKVQDHEHQKKTAGDGEQSAALVDRELGGEDKRPDGSQQPEKSADEGAQAEPKIVGQAQAGEVIRDGVAHGRDLAWTRKPSEKPPRRGPEKVAKASATQAGPDNLKHGQHRQDEQAGSPRLGGRTSGRNQFRVFPEAGDDSDRKEDKPGSDKKAAQDRGFSNSDKSAAQLAAFRHPPAGVNQISKT